MKIFLSHTYTDKPVVEPIALRLRDIFGQQSIFYDAWSIQPGDGIIQKMNSGLAAPDFVFFFVSAASLSSKMVELEWQNALYASTKGKVKIIPVRVDGTQMPAILSQNLWIDLHGNGIEVTIQQIVNVCQGMNTFTPQHQGFSNITYKVDASNIKKITLEIRASHLMEPNPGFLVLVENDDNEIGVSLRNGPYKGGFNFNVAKTGGGNTLNGFAIAPMGGALTPQHPLFIEVEQLGSIPIKLAGLAHEKAYGTWVNIPQRW